MMRGKRYLLFGGSLVCILWTGSPSAAKSTQAASENSLGLGLILGDPTAVGARYWFSPELAAQVWVGGTIQHEGAQIAVDLVIGIHDFIPTEQNKVQFDLSFGGGVALGAWSTGRHCHNDPWYNCHTHSGFALAARGPVTFSVILREVPLEFFVEVAAGLLLVPGVDFEIDGGLGARYYF